MSKKNEACNLMFDPAMDEDWRYGAGGIIVLIGGEHSRDRAVPTRLGCSKTMEGERSGVEGKIRGVFVGAWLEWDDVLDDKLDGMKL